MTDTPSLHHLRLARGELGVRRALRGRTAAQGAGVPPGLAHQRLTPSNADDLLFDDVMWVESAQRDHADFVNKLTHRGVEVVELHDLLAETIRSRGPRLAAGPQDRAQPRRPRARRRHPGVPRVAPAAQLAEFLIGGLATNDLPERLPVRLRRPGPGVDRCARVPDAAAAQHALHPRHHLLAVRRPDHEPAVLAGAQGRDADLQGDLPVPPGLRRLDGLVGRPGAGVGTGDVRGRRHHAGRQRRGADGHERAHVAPGDHAGGGRTVRAGRGGAGRRRRHAEAAGGDAPRHRLHVRRPRHRHPLPDDHGRGPHVHAAPSDKAPGVEVIDEGARRSSTSSPARSGCRSCASSRPAATSTRPSGSSGTAATTRSPSSPASCSPTTATR